MKNSKTSATFFLTIVLLTSCLSPTSSTTNEQIIKDYLKKNMNDPSSYESVEFIKIFDAKEQLGQIKSIYDRKSFLIENSITLLNSHIDEGLKKQINDLRSNSNKELDLTNSNLSIQIQNQDQLSQLITSAFLEIESKKILDENISEIKDQFEGTENRFTLEIKLLNESLQPYGQNIDNVSKNEQIISHKYRGKNGFGAFVLKQTIFIIDTISHTIISTKDI